MTTMNTFHSSNSVTAQIDELMRYSEFLYNKGLYDLSYRSTGKAKKLAYQHELFSRLLEILDFENMILIDRENDISKLTKNSQAINIEKKIVVDKIKITNEFYSLHQQLLLLYKKYSISRTEKQKNAFHEIIKNPLFKSEKKASTYSAKGFLYTSLSIYYLAIHDLNRSLIYCEKYLKLIETEGLRIEIDKKNLVKALNYVLVIVLNLINYEDALKIIIKLKSLKVKLEHFKIRIFEAVKNNKLNIYF